MQTPIVFYSSTIAPSGISFYRGQRIPQFANNLFVAALRGTQLLRLTTDARRVVTQERLLDGTFGRLRDVVTGPTGISISARTTAMAAAARCRATTASFESFRSSRLVAAGFGPPWLRLSGRAV